MGGKQAGDSPSTLAVSFTCRRYHPQLHLDITDIHRCMLLHSEIIYLIPHRVSWDLYVHIVKAVSAQERVFGDVLLCTERKQLQD